MTDTEALAREALELDGKATEGPWFDMTFGPEVGGPWVSVSCTWPDVIEVCTMANGLTGKLDEKEANARFIRFARTALPTLAREVIRLGEENERLERDRDDASDRRASAESDNAELNEAIKGWEAAERSWTEIRAGMERDNAALRARVERLEAALKKCSPRKAQDGAFTYYHAYPVITHDR